jgi:ankyrin repeat protein
MKLIKIAFLTALIMSSGLRGMEERQQQGLFNLFHRVNEIEKQNPNYQLINAAKFGSIQELDLLLKEGRDINGKDNYGNTALIVASNEGIVNICKFLLEHGANANASNDYDGRTALIVAAMRGYKPICELLIAHGANVNLPDKHNQTALMWAARKNHNEVCKLLIHAMIKLTPQERSEVSTLLNLKKREIPGLDRDTKNLIARTRLDDIKQEKKQNAREQIMKIENEALKKELLNYLENIK